MVSFARAWYAASALFLAAWALAPAAAPAASAQKLERTACQAFAGTEDCRTVAVVDAEACVLKIRPQPLPELDPAIAGCLIDEIGTRLIHLHNARDAEALDGAAGSTRVRLAGPAVMQELTAYDEAGAPVWQTRDEGSFAHDGGTAQTRAALSRLASGPCGAASEADGLAAAAGSIPRAIGVEEAWRLSAEERILLIDVRLESEWRETGIAATAIPITMHQRPKDFVQRLRTVAAADGGAPIALICARGERSAWLQRALEPYGFDGIIDVKGGMLGGNGAPGWIPAGLPVKPYTSKP